MKSIQKEDIQQFYSRINHDPDMHKSIFKKYYIGQLDFWNSYEIQYFGHLLDLSPKKELLDIGCGLCGPAIFLNEKFNCKITGIEISKENYLISKNRIKSFDLENKINVIHADSEHYKFSHNRFDAIIFIDSIVHIQNCYLLLENCFKWLKRNGKILIATEVVSNDCPDNLLRKRRELGKAFCRSREDYLDIIQKSGYELVDEIKYRLKRGKFAREALEWMCNNNQKNGYESMKSIYEISYNNFAFQNIFIIKK